MLQANVTSKLVQNKLGLLNLAQELNNISKACKVIGVSRDTFYRYQEAMQEGGVEGLLYKSRNVPNLKNRTDPGIEAKVLELTLAEPAWGQTRMSNELKKNGVSISGAGVRGIWLRHNLETFKKRLVHLEKTMASSGKVLTEGQLKALEKKEVEKEGHGEIETAHPGYLISQDTFYVGTIKGVGRIYQQTVVDTYSKVAFAKLYQMKTAICAADVLNDMVLPFFEEKNVPVLRVLTDRGTEFCGRPEDHEYQLFLAIKDIDHSRTKARHPQTNGICERFHRTILEEFYSIAFRKKIYKSLEELQIDLDIYIKKYNFERTHQGKMCCGRTPAATFIDGINEWNKKNINQFYKESSDDLTKNQNV